MNHHYRRLTLAACLTAILAAAYFGAPAQGATHTTRWVDDDGHAGAAGCGAHSTAFKKIQKAVDPNGICTNP